MTETVVGGLLVVVVIAATIFVVDYATNEKKTRKVMQQFVWAGKTYRFNATDCYNGSNAIQLPDGTILSVQEWYESKPPKPMRYELYPQVWQGIIAPTPAVEV